MKVRQMFGQLMQWKYIDIIINKYMLLFGGNAITVFIYGRTTKLVFVFNFSLRTQFTLSPGALNMLT